MVEAKEIIDYFNKIDIKKKSSDEYVRDTVKGIFGVSELSVLNDFFNKISLSENDIFVDLGSGDGRVNILASIYSKSIGIEFDKELVVESIANNAFLQTSAEFIEQDYELYDFSDTTIIFSFADHFFSDDFIKKLKKEFKGKLFVYEGIFTPDNLRKGKTIWIGQTPIISYQF